MDSGADAWMVDRKTSFEQGLRAEGADERGVHRDSYNQPDTEAAGEGRVNLTKQALRAEHRRFSPLRSTRNSATATLGLAYHKASRILNPLPCSSSAPSLVPNMHFCIIICRRQPEAGSR